MNALIRHYLYKSMITSYEYKPDKDETHVVTQFDYDNFANHIIYDSVKFLQEKGHNDLAQELLDHWKNSDI